MDSLSTSYNTPVTFRGQTRILRGLIFGGLPAKRRDRFIVSNWKTDVHIIHVYKEKQIARQIESPGQQRKKDGLPVPFSTPPDPNELLHQPLGGGVEGGRSNSNGLRKSDDRCKGRRIGNNVVRKVGSLLLLSHCRCGYCCYRAFLLLLLWSRLLLLLLGVVGCCRWCCCCLLMLLLLSLRLCWHYCDVRNTGRS